MRKVYHKIIRIAGNVITVDGVAKLHGCTYTVSGDHIEGGSFLALAAANGGDIKIEAPTDRALVNAIAANDVRTLALNQENLRGGLDTHFSHRVNSRGITDQESSGRCWLFTGFNVLRAKAMARHGWPSCEFSQGYSFFWDQLEKSNLFLQGIIDTRERPLTDQMVEWLLKHPLSDGGTYTGVADLVAKYGIVPAEVMPETFNTNNTSRITSIIKQKLREFALQLRDAKGGKKELETLKTEMLGTIYRMLVLSMGEPVKQFTWAPKDADGKPLSAPKTYTPQSFYKEWFLSV